MLKKLLLLLLAFTVFSCGSSKKSTSKRTVKTKTTKTRTSTKKSSTKVNAIIATALQNK